MNWLDRLRGRPEQVHSGQIAADRAKVVVKFDRARLDTGTIEQIRHDIAEVIARYAPISADEVSVEFVEGPPRIVADIPLKAPPAPGVGGPGGGVGGSAAPGPVNG